MSRAWAMALLGVWLAGTVGVAVVATENFFTIDRLLADSPNLVFHTTVEKIGEPVVRDLLRYLSSELNRLYFQRWNILEMAIGILTLWLVVRDGASPRSKWCVVGMLGVVMAMFIWLTPQIVNIGRDLDFVPRDPVPPALRIFGLYHAAYTVLSVLKLILGVLAAVWLQLDGPGVNSRKETRA